MNKLLYQGALLYGPSNYFIILVEVDAILMKHICDTPNDEGKEK